MARELLLLFEVRSECVYVQASKSFFWKDLDLETYLLSYRQEIFTQLFD